MTVGILLAKIFTSIQRNHWPSYSILRCIHCSKEMELLPPICYRQVTPRQTLKPLRCQSLLRPV